MLEQLPGLLLPWFAEHRREVGQPAQRYLGRMGCLHEDLILHTNA